MKVYTQVFGCSSNVADYEIASGILKRDGFNLVENADQSDLNIIFTCNVKSPTSQKMICKIKELTEKNKPLIVAGCMTMTERSVIEKISPNASLLGPDSIEKVTYAAIAAMQGKKTILMENYKKPKLCMPRERKNPLVGVIPISSGCLSNCSYCSVKFVRGKLFSYPVDMIVREAKNSIEDNCKEIYLTSQDSSCYGLDIGKRLPELLNEICNIQGKFFIRVGMMNPLYSKEIIDDLIKSYKRPEVFKFLHLPVQSGSDRILNLMKRGYSAEDFIEMVARFREEIPEITINTDVIVGFPNETSKDFESTVKLIERLRPDAVNISKFGSRPMTEAAKMEQLDSKTINDRSSFLHILTKKISLEKNKRWIGWRGEVLVDEKIDSGFVGRNFAYKPIIIKTNEKLFGKFVNVKIVDATSNCLFSEKI